MSKLRVKEIAHSNSTNAATVAADGGLTFAKNISQTDLQWWNGWHNSSAVYGAGSTITNWSKQDGNGITHSSGVWTIPVAGVYRVNLSMLMQSASGGIYWWVNSTQHWRIAYGNPTTGNTADWQNIGGTIMYNFSANDTLKFTSQSGSANFYGDTSTASVSTMCIYKVG